MNKSRTIPTFVTVAMLFSVSIVSPANAQEGCSSSGAPVVNTDQEDYPPLGTVVISGSGFGCGELLSVLVTAPDGTTRSGDGSGSDGPDDVTTDSSGEFILSYPLFGNLPGGGTYEGQNGEYTIDVADSAGARLASTTFTDGSAFDHTCAITTAGGLKCWGKNSSGQLGNGTTTNSSIPLDVPDLASDVAWVSAGGGNSTGHTCAVTTGGAVKCWGENQFGMVGDGTNTDRATPVDVVGLASGVAEVSAGGGHTCALTTSGGVKCWGLNNDSQVSGSFGTSQFPTPVDGNGLSSGIAQVSAGFVHTCALTTTGVVRCWGHPGDGRLGGNGLVGATQVSAGGLHSCAIMADGGVKCWGENFYGQLGNGTFGDSGTPVDVVGLDEPVVQIAAGFLHTCALLASGAAKCWGENFEGQIGDGSVGFASHRSTPVDVVGLGSGVARLVGGYRHTCALTTAGGVTCWGSNGSGQLGDGTTTRRLTPVDVDHLRCGVNQILDGPSRGSQPSTPHSVCGPYAMDEGATIPLSSDIPSDSNLSTPRTYNWSVDSLVCSFDDASQAAANLTCVDNGNFTVSLDVDDGDTAPVTSSATILVANVAPALDPIEVRLAWNGVSTALIEVGSVIDTASIGTDPGTLDTHTAEWDWGDGTTSAGDIGGSGGTLALSDAHTYGSPGMYTIRLTVTDKDGGTDERTASITVEDNVAPTATFQTPGVSEGSVGTISLINAYDPSEEDSAAGFRYAFDCDGGSLSSATYANSSVNSATTCIYSDNGIRAVSAKIIDRDGGATEYIGSVSVSNVAPTADFVNDGPASPGETVTIGFQNVFDPSTVDTDAGVHYAFSCDGPISGRMSYLLNTGIDSSHSCTYAVPGTYTAYGRMFDKDNGRSDHTTTVIIEENVSPIASAGGPYAGNEGSPILLSEATATDQNSSDVLSYSWIVDSPVCSFDDASLLNPGLTCSDNVSATVTLSVDDGNNPAVTSGATVTVGNVAPSLGSLTLGATLIPVGTALTAGASFTDPGTLDTHTAAWDWGDGASVGTVTQGAGFGSVADGHTYGVPGVYTIRLSVTDNDAAVSNESVYQYVVVYDPSGGFVTGGGWIDSPAGAYVADRSLTGKASFGFVAKYKKGANAPDGNTQFQFKAGDMNFHSANYDWLVVAGTKAKFKGNGTINGAGDYKFLISANDDNPDTFRIQIWNDDLSVYDNGSQQTLGGGSIKVHT